MTKELSMDQKFIKKLTGLLEKNFGNEDFGVQKLADEINTEYGRVVVTIDIKDQYYNMKEKVEPVKHIVDIAEEAMNLLNIKPIIKPIRGGTDGSQLSYMGLPCPNIFAMSNSNRKI